MLVAWYMRNQAVVPAHFQKPQCNFAKGCVLPPPPHFLCIATRQIAVKWLSVRPSPALHSLLCYETLSQCVSQMAQKLYLVFPAFSGVSDTCFSRLYNILQGPWAASILDVVQHHWLLGCGLHHRIPAHLQSQLWAGRHMVGHLLGHFCDW